MSQEIPRLLIATLGFGASGQPWLWRQVMGLTGFQKQVLCWVRWNVETYPANGIPVVVVPEDPAPYNGSGRWWLRLRNLLSRNFYASVGRERQRLDRLLRQERPSAVLCYFGDIAMRLLPVARYYQIPIVAYFHGDFQFVYNRWYRWSLQRCLREFAAIPVVTEAERSWMLKQGVPESKILIVPCGLPTGLFRPIVKEPQDRPVRFVMVSRLSPEKGCDVSARAFAKITSELPGAELHVYGDGPERETLVHLVESLGLKEQIVFHGYVGEQALAEALPSYDIFIQHSVQKEGAPVSIVEAMACGLPVIATPVGGIVTQVIDGETGLLVSEHDISAMANAMLKLAKEVELRHRFGRSGRERAVKLYDASVLTRRLEQVLWSVVRQ